MSGVARWLARRIVRLAALRAPREQRGRMVREWDAELEREFRSGDSWACVAAAMGAFADAGAIRDVNQWDGKGKMARLSETVRSDFKQAARALLRAPAFTAVAVLTLAVGIGGSAAIYTLLDRVVLDPLPFPESERLVRLANQVPGIGPDAIWSLSTAQFVYYADRATTLDEVGLYRRYNGNVTTADGASRARGVGITASAGRILGHRAHTGRVLDESDDQPGAPLVAVVSHEFWTRALGGDAGAVGGTVVFNDRPHEIVGVLEPGASLPGVSPDRAPELWMTLRINRTGTFQNSHVFPAIGRMASDVTPDAVESELARLESELPTRFPNAYSESFLEGSGFRTMARPLKEDVLGDLASRLWLLFAGVGMVLLIAAANVANLFLVRMDGRRQELAVRRALGAGRSDLGRFVFSEGLTLSATGGLLSLVVGIWAVPAMARLAPSELPRVEGVSIDAGTLLFSIVLSLVVGLMVAAYPALGPTTDRGTGSLAGGARGSTGSSHRQRVRSALVAVQMGFAVALLVGAGMLVDGLRALRATDPGFVPTGVYAMDVHASQVRYPDDVSLWSFHKEILRAISSLPGVVSVGMGEEIPVSGGYGCTVQGFEDATVVDRIREAGLTTCAGQSRVTPGYFETLDIPLIEGRLLEEGDYDDPSRGAVVVSRAFAERFWPGQSAIGQGVGPNGRNVGPLFHVVGVVDDVKKRASEGRAPLEEDAIAIYYPGVSVPDVPGRWDYWWPGSMTLLVGTAGAEAGDLTAAVRRAVQEIDPETPVANARSMEDVVGAAMASLSFLTLLMGIAAGIALGLATIGLYGVVSYVVSQRRREIGMRLAIGAAPSSVVRGIVAGTIRLVAVGLVLGVPLAMLTTRVGRSALVGIEPTAPGAYLAAAAAVGVVSTIAAWLPARRAAAIDPVESLRAE